MVNNLKMMITEISKAVISNAVIPATDKCLRGDQIMIPINASSTSQALVLVIIQFHY